jgi:predicted TPR repeat methyltransferase
MPRADLILILDVLQYLRADEQRALLSRCCSALEPKGKFIFRVHDRCRGILSTLSLAFDHVIFAFGRAGVRPLMLSAVEYRSALEDAGMQIEERRFRNRLPLAHIVFIATKPPFDVKP